MGTKKAKKWCSIKVDYDTYKKILKIAKNRQESMSHLISSYFEK